MRKAKNDSMKSSSPNQKNSTFSKNEFSSIDTNILPKVNTKKFTDKLFFFGSKSKNGQDEKKNEKSLSLGKNSNFTGKCSVDFAENYLDKIKNSNSYQSLHKIYPTYSNQEFYGMSQINSSYGKYRISKSNTRNTSYTSINSKSDRISNNIRENVNRNQQQQINKKVMYLEKMNFQYEKKINTAMIAHKQKEIFLNKFYNPPRSDPMINIYQFKLLKTLGRGSFGRVILSLFLPNLKFYAVKVLDKGKLIKDNQVEHLLNERAILSASDHPNIVKLQFCFKDNTFVYLVVDIAYHGDLYTVLKIHRNFDEDLSRFFAANIFLALEYLHINDILYRDLKPENILVYPNGYLKLTDFGFAKRVEGTTRTLCGTPDYISPEVLSKIPYGKSVDWWAFGIFIFELNRGKTPFYSKEQKEIFDKILSCDYKIPEKFSFYLADICKKLLQSDPNQRLGCLQGGSNDIRDHIWFNSIDWIRIYYQTYPSPYKPVPKTLLTTAFLKPNKSDESKLSNVKEDAKQNSKEEDVVVLTKDVYKNEFSDF